MARVRGLLTAVAVTAATIGVGAATTPAAGDVRPAALPTCDQVKHNFYPWEQINTWVPIYSFNGSTNCILARGNAGPAVRVLQQALNDCYSFPDDVSNANNGKIGVDGIYGPETYRAVRYVQGREGIARDGVYGPQTFSRMLWPQWDGAYSGPYYWGGCLRSGMGG